MCCFLRLISSPVDHYNPGNILGCPAAQFVDVIPFQYDDILAGWGDQRLIHILRTILWIGYLFVVRLIPSLVVCVIGSVTYIVGTIILSPILLVFQLYYQKVDADMFKYVGLVLSVFVILLLCGCVDCVWLPIRILIGYMSGSLTSDRDPNHLTIYDQLLMHSIAISFLMLIDIDG